jgi:hypothetical protein
MVEVGAGKGREDLDAYRYADRLVELEAKELGEEGHVLREPCRGQVRVMQKPCRRADVRTTLGTVPEDAGVLLRRDETFDVPEDLAQVAAGGAELVGAAMPSALIDPVESVTALFNRRCRRF